MGESSKIDSLWGRAAKLTPCGGEQQNLLLVGESSKIYSLWGGGAAKFTPCGGGGGGGAQNVLLVG